MNMNSKNKSRKGSVDSNIWSSPPIMKEICKCCRKDLGLFGGNIALFRGKCLSCRQKICTDCVVRSLCHKCQVKRYITLNPKELMKLPSKRLIEISTTLHFHNPQGYEKSELVQIILAIYGCKWKRPIPQEPGITPSVAQENGKCVLCETEPTYMCLVFCLKCTAMLNQPEFLMNLPGRQLHCILKLLQIPEHEIKVREKGELVTLVLDRIGTGTGWKPPLPQQPSTSNPKHNAEAKTPISVLAQNEESTLQQLPESKNDVPTDCLLNNVDQRLSNDDDEEEDDDVVMVVGAGNNDETEHRLSSWAHVENVNDITDISVIQQLKSYQLKLVLRSLGEETEGICERNELLNRVTELWTIWRNQNSMRTEVENNSQSQVEVENGADPDAGGGTRIFFPRDVPELKSLANEEDIKALNVRQLKMILQKYSVNYTGCRERSELADKVVNLWKEQMKWSKIADDLPDEDTCKICMDAPIDCVLLECGHMVACTECGRQMSECPICRQFVIRVVHTFKV